MDADDERKSRQEFLDLEYDRLNRHIGIDHKCTSECASFCHSCGANIGIGEKCVCEPPVPDPDEVVDAEKDRIATDNYLAPF